MCLPLMKSATAAPTLPSSAKLSEKICMLSRAFLIFLIESSLFSVTLVLRGIFSSSVGFHTMVGIFSSDLASGLNHFRRWCMGPLCLLIFLIPWWFMHLYNGCSLGSAAILVSAWWHHFLTVSAASRRCAWVLSTSIAKVLSPPMMANTPALCIVAI